MTATLPAASETLVPGRKPLGQQVVRLLTTTDHKLIGKMYLVTSFAWFCIGGLMALVIRSELAFPGQQVVNDEVYNQMFTMHGTIMLLLFATPLFFGFSNVIMPLQIGAPDVAFPRLNMFSYWLFLFGGLIAAAGFFTPNGAASFGWFAYTPLSNEVRSPGVGGDMWIMGLYMAGLGTILGAVNFITTIICMRAPGMTMFRMSIFVWNTLITSLLVLIAFPILAGALLMLESDRTLGTHVFDAAHGGPILWQHLFWFFGHPEVYIIALPFFGIVSEILPVFSRKPLFGYVGLVAATLGIAILSVAVWAHHMFVTGAVNLPFFSGMTFLIAVPTGVKFFNWIGTMWGGSLSFDNAMLWSIGFLTTFLVQHWLGVEGMPRRYADYLSDDGFTALNQISTVGAFILSVSLLPFFYNVYVSAKGPKVEVDDPWGWGRSLEWATSCPPPRHNFVSIPKIRSESPAFDLHHPEIAALELAHNEAEREGRAADAPDVEGRADLLAENGADVKKGDDK